MSEFQDVQVGDLLYMRTNGGWHHGPKVLFKLYKVVRKTKTQLIVFGQFLHSEIRVRIEDGRVIGGSRYSYMSVVTPEIRAEYEEQVSAFKRYRGAEIACADLFMKDLVNLKLTVEQLEALGKAWTEIKAMVKDEQEKS